MLIPASKIAAISLGLMLVSACTHQTSDETEPTNPESAMNQPQSQLSIEEQANADAKKAIDDMDYKLFAMTNKIIKVPGVDEQQHSVNWLEKHCGLRMLEGSGDTVEIGEDMQKRKDAKQYATIYNQVVLKACVVFQKNYTP
ncbi:hypothetical protein OAP14_08355 [Aliiglaciecola sp.]|nr:hypothetical protein [Aliiglaciecola sp.]